MADSRSIRFALALAGAMAPSAAVEAAEHEAPMLAERVAAGELPPLAVRLPERPEIIAPVDEIGRYGGTLRRALAGSNDHNNILRIVGPQGLTRWNADWTAPLPNVAESWDVEDEGRAFVFHLRPGMKWSDGHPFGADDILFNVDDLMLNPDFGPVPARYVIGGEPVAVEKIDDVTVRFTFAAPFGSFPAELASPRGQHPVLHPRHYCGQFHPDHADDIEALLKAENVPDWPTLFQNKCGDIEIPARWGNPDKPTLDPWVIVEPYAGGATRVTLERNPYFWQVDTEGNQLPYIDAITNTVMSDSQAVILEAIAGRIDLQARHLDNPADRPVLAQNREAGGYDFFETYSTGGTLLLLQPNLNHKDEELRDLFNKKDFRVALSLGMDRKRMIDIALLGQGEPWQYGPYRDSPLFHERIATQFLDYDPETANALLDDLGLSRRDAEGFRLLPSGRRVAFKVDVIPTLFTEALDLLELTAQDWEKLGIDMEINSIERSFFFERVSSNYDHDWAVWPANAGWQQGTLLQEMVPIWQGARYGIGWWKWVTSDGKQGVEPPGHVKKRLALNDEARAAVTFDEYKRVVHEIADIAADQFEVIGTSTDLPRYGIVGDRLRNVPGSMPSSFDYPTPAPTLPQQYFFAE
ncbi:MAG: ABC transporter substrate-binding protein [Geminicoccaceae bacterium]|nr:ABC transporter substrate-binding protein [Geminicoccaceae bacterium]